MGTFAIKTPIKKVPKASSDPQPVIHGGSCTEEGHSYEPTKHPREQELRVKYTTCDRRDKGVSGPLNMLAMALVSSCYWHAGVE